MIFGANAPRLPNTSNFALPGIAAETARDGARSRRRDGQFRLGLLVGQGRAVACAARHGRVARALARCALRVSFGWNSTEADVDAALASLVQSCVARSCARGGVSSTDVFSSTRNQEAGRRDRREVQIRLRHRHRDGARAARACREDTVRYISAKKGEPEWMLEWRLGAFARWLQMTEPNWARVHYPEDRLPERLLLRRAQEHAAEAEPGRGRSQAAGDLQEARHSAARADGAGRRRGRRGVRLRFGRHHLQGKAQRSGRDLLPDLAKRSATIPIW